MNPRGKNFFCRLKTSLVKFQLFVCTLNKYSAYDYCCRILSLQSYTFRLFVFDEYAYNFAKQQDNKERAWKELSSLLQNEYLLIHFKLGLKCYKNLKIGEVTDIFKSLRVLSYIVRKLKEVSNIISKLYMHMLCLLSLTLFSILFSFSSSSKQEAAVSHNLKIIFFVCTLFFSGV